MTWRYFWRVTALHRTDTSGDAGDLPHPLPPDLVDERTKTLADGVGPMFHRRFAVRIADSAMAPVDLLDAIAGDPNRAAPWTVAVFHKTLGDEGVTRVGDEFRVQMPGPWDGPVRVVRRDANSMRFGTLQGHLEAGQIQFRATRTGEVLEFEIEAWSRGGDPLANVLYSRLRVAKEIQFNMWVHFCLRAAVIAGGRVVGGVRIETRAIPEELCQDFPGD